MNTKKIAAVIAAGTMLLATIPVSAAETATNGATTVTSSGTVNAYDTTPIFEVTLPTANSLQFTVDPYGLLDIETGDKVNVDDLANSGAIVAASGSGAVIMNESSVPVTVGVKLSVTDTGSAQFKTVQADVASGTANNMLLALVPSADKVTVVSGTATGYSEAEKVLAITETSTPVADNAKFYLAKAKYDVENTGSGYKLVKTVEAGNYDATMFKVGGAVNPNADWSEYVASGSAAAISLEAVFSYEEAGESDADTVEGIYGLVSGSATDLVDFETNSVTKNITVTDASDKIVKLASSNVKTVTFAFNGKANTTNIVPTNATLSDKTLTVKGSWLKGFVGGTGSLTVVYNDGTPNQVIAIN